jgi:hypothetical protein
MELTNLEKAESYNAIRSFFNDIKLYRGCLLQVYLIFTNEQEREQINEVIEITHIESQRVYTLSCNSFYSYNLRNPLWSSYQLFKWDEKENYLFTSHNGYKVTFERK